ncbi:MAG: hypothetical protein A3F54_05565 [Candidatus Kerfeldbacteria bacterium RIFCSPHIGHO2_12_FULL_48_17]|uniref:HIT domain-containing protein n=1 Tax=Candidatus Kerfeldbacteria bacterium RIFCSPHIGHO2_12_FULL_48_17 TaxID=1798542 RepID=A0A1G2B6D6_9BACT|nr:MAG: hypothetical protein A3F54_05565 [Candidatus Kerfeldbacteria bacterium RIFCSPHIGHO2_12_FULL_48_17]
MGCAFCNETSIQARTILKNAQAFVFPTNIPIVPGHVLIVPTRHVATMDELTPAEWQAIHVIMKKMKAALRKAFQAEGFNYAMNEGSVAGQSVPHLHIHLLPRKTGDSGITEYEPRQFLYRPGSRKTSPDAELNVVTKIIRAALK